VFIDLVETGAPWAQLESMILAWSETPHQPAISEHARQCLRRHEGVALVDADRPAMVTMVPGRVAGNDLIEMAGPAGVDLGEVWAGVRSELMATARARGRRSVAVLAGSPELVDRLRHDDLIVDRRVLRGTIRECDLNGFQSSIPIRVFRPGVDEGALLELIRVTFQGHPENGAWAHEDLSGRLNEPWFDERGLFLGLEGGKPIGVGWTKVHLDRVGEVYLVGVHPEHTGRGVGRDLVYRSLEHLFVTRKCPEAIVYWDESNETAANLYREVGFTVDRVDEVYRLEI